MQVHLTAQVQEHINNLVGDEDVRYPGGDGRRGQRTVEGYRA